MPSSTSPPFRFLDLPTEIRDQIYCELFLAPKSRRDCPDGTTRYIFDLRVLRTSKQVYREAKYVFRQKNLFASIETPWAQAEGFVIREGGVPLVANESGAESFEPCHIKAIIGSPDMEAAMTAKFIISVDDLEAFCWIWFYSNLTYVDMNRHLSLKLVVTNQQKYGNPLPLSAQRRLTQPFGLIKNLGKFDIEGDIDGDTEAALRKIQETPFDSPLLCLQKSLHLLEAGDAELKDGKSQVALTTYTKAFHAIHIVIEGRSRTIHAKEYFRTRLPTPLFDSYNAEYVHVTMRIKLVASTMQALLKLEQWEEAHFWGMRSITLCRQDLGEGAEIPGHPSFPAPRDWGKIYYRTAMAAEKLEMHVQAKDMYRIALAWLPGDVGVEKAFMRITRRLG